MKETVCVTGAAGFIAGHIVIQLLEKGYVVRATVRSLKDKSKIQFLEDFRSKYPDQLFLFEADLAVEGSFDKALESSTIVIHTASPVGFTAKNPKDIYEPAVKGTQNVFRSINKHKSIRTVVMTSSTAAVTTLTDPTDQSYSESDWNKLNDPNQFPYTSGKTAAEQWAWKFVNEEMSNRVKLVTILPDMTIGPLQNNVIPASLSVIKSLIAGDYPGSPKLFFVYVDVRDVALAHILAFENSNASGRYIISSEGYWFVEMAKVLQSKFPHISFPVREIPNFVTLIAGIFDPRISVYQLWTSLGKTYKLDNSKATRELGIKFRPVDKSMEEAANSLLERKLVTPKKALDLNKIVAVSIIVGIGAILAYVVNNLLR